MRWYNILEDFKDGQARNMDETDRNARKTLMYLKSKIEEYLDELNCVKDIENDDFSYGEKTALVECLEIIQLWDDAEEAGLDYVIEDRYPL